MWVKKGEGAPQNYLNSVHLGHKVLSGMTKTIWINSLLASEIAMKLKIFTTNVRQRKQRKHKKLRRKHKKLRRKQKKLPQRKQKKLLQRKERKMSVKKSYRNYATNLKLGKKNWVLLKLRRKERKLNLNEKSMPTPRKFPFHRISMSWHKRKPH